MEKYLLKFEGTSKETKRHTEKSAGDYAVESVIEHRDHCVIFNRAMDVIDALKNPELRRHYREKIILHHRVSSIFIPDRKNPDKCVVHSPKTIPDAS